MAEGSVEQRMGGDAAVNKEEKVNEEDAEATVWFNRKWRMDLLVGQHARFCLKIMHSLPPDCDELETQRITLLQFMVTSLDILNQLHLIKEERKCKIIDWIYSLQITDDPPDRCGFQGSPCVMLKDHCALDLPSDILAGHVAMTYAALVTLITLGDDLSRVSKKKILQGIGKLQNPSGSFRAGHGCSESDMRFTYCVVCICYILNDFSTINVPKLLEFIKSSFTYEGSFTSGLASEGHAGHTFCAVASLSLLNKLHDVLSTEEISRLLRWCLMRQGSAGGFTGRTNKEEDTCYSYWVGGTLSLLGGLSLIDCDKNVDFVLGNQNPLTGGIGKLDNQHVDPLHTFLGLAGLSLVKYKGLNNINPMLTMSSNATKHLQYLQEQWAR